MTSYKSDKSLVEDPELVEGAKTLSLSKGDTEVA